jgi:Acetyltransferase (GNAT) domain
VTASDSLCVRGYQNGDEEQINRLFNLVFQADRSLAEWRWKFQENPVGLPLNMAITVAELEGKIVGQYASIMVPFKLADKVVLAAQPVDNLVHPEFRGGGRLQLQLFALQPAVAKKGGVVFGFGFPNEIAYAAGKRLLNYQDLGPLPTLFLRLSWRHSFRRRFPKLPGWLVKIVGFLSVNLYKTSLAWHGRRDLVLREVSNFDARINALWESAKDSYDILAVRDRQTLNWRYAMKPFAQYTILINERQGIVAGYIVLKVNRQEQAVVGLIVDIFSLADSMVEEALVRGALSWFSGKGTDYVLCRMLRDDRIYSTLLRCGFQEHAAFAPLPVVYHVFTEEIDERCLREACRWHLTFGDSDGV